MVRWFVEQQQVWLLQQQLRQRDAHLPAAGELFGRARPIFLAETEPLQHRSDLRLDRVTVARLELVLQLVKAISDVLHIQLLS